MAAQEGSRKRLKVSRVGEHVPSPVIASATCSKVASSSTDDSNACTHNQMLKTLNTDIEAMRHLITCKICDRFLYEPYSLTCGHTYCYSCLTQWFVSNKKKTCPDCRAVTKVQPTPSYVIRELVLIFVSRNELLPDGETAEEHHEWAKAEGKMVTDDRASTDRKTGGLFKGCFARGRRIEALHDPGDGVDRCPECHWEMEGNVCSQCGFDDDGDDSDDSWDSYGIHTTNAYGRRLHDDDFYGADDFEGDEDEEQELTEAMLQENARLHRSIQGPIVLGSSDDEISEDDEEDPTMGQFVVDDDDEEVDHSSEWSDAPVVTHTRRLQTAQPPPIVELSDDETAPSTEVDFHSTATVSGDEHSDDEDEEPVSRGSQRHRARPMHVSRRGLRRTIDSESSQGSEDDDDQTQLGQNSPAANSGFSPLDDGMADYHSRSSQSDYDNVPLNMFLDAGHHSGGSSGEDSTEDETGIYLALACRPDVKLNVIADDDNRLTPWPRSHHGRPHHRTWDATGRPSDTRGVPVERGNGGFFQSAAAMRTAAQNPRALPARQTAQGPSTGSTSNGSRSRPVAHPFQLDNTLAGINYNQRHQQARAQPVAPTARSGGSSRAIRHDSGSGSRTQDASGSTETLRASEGRRKRHRSDAAERAMDRVVESY